MESFARRIRDFDRVLFKAVFRFKWPPFTALMRGFTVLGTAGFLWGVVAAAAFVLSGLDPRHLLIPWAAVVISWTLAEGSKYLFNRTRPYIYDTAIAPLIKTPSSSSFPSGHSATAAAGAITLSATYPAFTPLFLLAGFLVALSRIYLGVHYPFDVLAGVLIGVAVAVVLLVLA